MGLLEGKIYCIGDIHGNFKGLEQAIERSPFNPEEDTLISLGDLVDGGSDVYEVLDYLVKIPNFILILGNHDAIFIDWVNFGINTYNWGQGGHTTAKSYIDKLNDSDGGNRKIVPSGKDGYLCQLNPDDIPKKHQLLLRSAHKYFVHEGMCFVHGGFNRFLSLNQQSEYDLYWNRDLWYKAMSSRNSQYELKMVEEFDKVFLGHTTTLCWNTDKPIKAGRITNLDTGAGSTGKVTIMDVNTEEYWQSDNVEDLYGYKSFR